jgi:hypothetical protein
MTDVINAEFTETALAVVEQQQPVHANLFHTDDPIKVLEKASVVAKALVHLSDKQGLIANVKGKKYPQVEAWQTMGAMLSLSTVTEWTKPIDGGWEARVVLHNRHGQVIGAAEAQCTKFEQSKGNWADYALRSMAQTRATSKAYRSNLAFVMVLAGYEPTPAEEMDAIHAPAQEQPLHPDPSAKRREEVKAFNARVHRLVEAAQAKGVNGPFDVAVIDGKTLRDWASAYLTECFDWKPGTKPTEVHFLAMEKELLNAN